MKTKLKQAWAWCKKNWKAVVMALGVFFALLGMIFCSSRRIDSKIAFRELDLSKKKQEAARLKGQKEILEVNRKANEKEIEILESALEGIEKEIVHSRAEISKLSLKRKLGLYDDLGY